MLYLIRHEETPLNGENRYRGNLDPGLTKTGRVNAIRLGQVVGPKVNRIIADDYRRTKETAAGIAKGRPVELDKGLNNWDIGRYSGLEKTPERVKEFDANHVDHPGNRPAGGESLNEFLGRWKPVYQKYLKQAKSENIALVTHGSNLGAVLSGFKPAPIQDRATKKTGSIIEVGEDGVPKFLEKKLKAEASKKGFTGKKAAKYVYGAMNNMGAMKGNQETAKGRAMQAKHAIKIGKLARA